MDSELLSGVGYLSLVLKRLPTRRFGLSFVEVGVKGPLYM